MSLYVGGMVLLILHIIDLLRVRPIPPHQPDTVDAAEWFQMKRSEATRSAKSLPASVKRKTPASIINQPLSRN